MNRNIKYKQKQINVNRNIQVEIGIEKWNNYQTSIRGTDKREQKWISMCKNR